MIGLGMQRILDFAAGIRFSRQLQAQGTCVLRNTADQARLLDASQTPAPAPAA